MSISGTGHSKCPGKSMGTEQTPWNLPAPHTIPSVCHHQLRALPLQGCPEKTKQRLFHQLMWYFGWLHISVMSEGHSPICRIPAGEALGLALVCSPHRSHPDCKRHPQKGLQPFAITECNYQHQDSAEAQFLGIQDLYWKEYWSLLA